jgi:hypothetical protein
MEGTMEKFANDVFTDKPALKVGDKYKITGGKYKKYKTGTLCKVNHTYSDVIVDSEEMQPNGKRLKEIISKVKNCYLHPVQGLVIEMPEAKDLLVVENLDEFLKKEPAPMVAPQTEEPFDGVPAVCKETGEVQDDITDILPTVDEAIALRKENKQLKKDNNGLRKGVDDANKVVREQKEHYLKEVAELVKEIDFRKKDTEKHLEEVFKHNEVFEAMQVENKNLRETAEDLVEENKKLKDSAVVFTKSEVLDLIKNICG